MKRYKVIEDVALADIAFEIYGRDVDELFENAAFALFEETADLNKIEENQTKEIFLEADDLEHLLYDFLSELLFLKDSESMIFKTSKVKVEENKFKLHATVRGEPIDHDKHTVHNDIKAITLHMFKVEKTNSGWKAFVVVDI